MQQQNAARVDRITKRKWNGKFFYWIYRISPIPTYGSWGASKLFELLAMSSSIETNFVFVLSLPVYNKRFFFLSIFIRCPTAEYFFSFLLNMRCESAEVQFLIRRAEFPLKNNVKHSGYSFLFERQIQSRLSNVFTHPQAPIYDLRSSSLITPKLFSFNIVIWQNPMARYTRIN